MKNLTITIFVETNSLQSLLTTLKILENLDIENNYIFTPSDIKFSEAMISNWIFLNIDIELYLKFKYCYNKLKK